MSNKVVIYKPAKNAMQSGLGNSKWWCLQFVSDDRKFVEPVMGWIGSKDTTRHLVLKFPSKESAINYACAHKLQYEICQPHKKKIKAKSYAANFASGKRQYCDLNSI